MATLENQINSLSTAGFSNQEIEAWKKDKVETLSKAGFTTQEIAKDLGYKEINLTPIRNYWNKIITLEKKSMKKFIQN